MTLASPLILFHGGNYNNNSPGTFRYTSYFYCMWSFLFRTAHRYLHYLSIFCVLSLILIKDKPQYETSYVKITFQCIVLVEIFYELEFSYSGWLSAWTQWFSCCFINMFWYCEAAFFGWWIVLIWSSKYEMLASWFRGLLLFIFNNDHIPIQWCCESKKCYYGVVPFEILYDSIVVEQKKTLMMQHY
jgi:hypothetical protein